MKLYTDKESITLCAGKHLLLDNDFLSELLRDEEILQEFLIRFSSSFLIVDPLTEFEFLRDVFDPQQRRIKEAFIAKPIFLPIANRQEIFLQLQENALLLSKLYSQKGHNKNTKISLVDLFLGARGMLNANSTMIVTGNKKDFPASIFDLIAVMNIEENDGSLKPYSVVSFNKTKFQKCYKDMQVMEEKYKNASRK